MASHTCWQNSAQWVEFCSCAAHSAVGKFCRVAIIAYLSFHSDFQDTCQYDDDECLWEKKKQNQTTIWISNALLEHRPPALRPPLYPSHIFPVELSLCKRIFRKSSVQPQQTSSFWAWHLCLSALQMRESRKQSLTRFAYLVCYG